MGENYKGRLCIATGAARGIGKACAAKFAEYGGDVVMVDINKKVLEKSAAEIAAKYGVKIYAYVVDISSFEACEQFMAEVNAKIGTVDVLANCAGITVAKHMIDLTPAEWERVMGVNLRSIWCLSQLFAKQLKDNTRKIMEIFEATGQKNGKVIGHTLYRFNVQDTVRDGRGHVTKVIGNHTRTGCISPRLYSRLRDNGAPEQLLQRLFPGAVGEEVA